MKKKIKILIGVIVAFIVAAIVASAIYLVMTSDNQETPSPVVEKSAQQAKKEEAIDINKAFVPSKEQNALLLLKFTDLDWGMFEAEVKEQMTVFDLLKLGTGELKLELETKDYKDMGVLVEKIGEKKNGEDGKYWMYYVNGVLAQVGADKQVINKKDTVEWRFEKPSF